MQHGCRLLRSRVLLDGQAAAGLLRHDLQQPVVVELPEAILRPLLTDLPIRVVYVPALVLHITHLLSLLSLLCFCYYHHYYSNPHSTTGQVCL